MVSLLVGLSQITLAHSSNKIPQNQWIQKGGQKYLEINAKNHYELGTLEGTFLAEQILYLDGLLEQLVISYGYDMDAFLAFCYIYEQFIPLEYIQEMKGISDVLPISYEKILLQNVWLDLYYGQLIPAQAFLSDDMGCTAIGVNHKFLDTIGQNLDFGAVFLPSISWIKYKVANSPNVFCLMLGSAKLPSGKNEYVICTTNLVQTILPGSYAMPYSICSRLAFETSKSANDFLNKVICKTSSWNYIILNNPYKYRNAVPIGVESLNGYCVFEEGTQFVVRTNTFVSPYLKPYLINQEYSVDRQERATNLIKEDKDRFTLKDCGELLSDDLIVKDFSGNIYSTITLAFFFSNGRFTYFGIGNPRDSEWAFLLF
jgi:hypothetical protein